MIENGITLYAHADKLESVGGMLLRHLRPPNTEAARVFSGYVACLIYSMRDAMIEQVNRLPAKPYSVEQKRKNYTIRKLRVIASRMTKQAHLRMKENTWKG